MAKTAKELVGGKKVLVIGVGVTGFGVAEALAPFAGGLWITDTRDPAKIAAAIKRAKDQGCSFINNDELEGYQFDLAVTSPGISFNEPILTRLREKGTPVVSEIEAAFDMMAGKMIAVTGTNGKTTTTTLIGEILKSHFSDVRVAGNIGDPLIGAVVGSTKDTRYAVEISSYQLEGIVGFRPDVAVVLNVTPDHRERHPTMRQYADAKARLLENQTNNDTAILNFGDPLTAEMSAKTKAGCLWFGDIPADADGAFIGGVTIHLRRRGKESPLMKTTELTLQGRHNHENVMAAALACVTVGVPIKKIKSVAASFHGLEHRMEVTAEIGGVTFVNDSKATNPASAIVALRSYPPSRVVLLIGGDDKGLDYSEFIQVILETAKDAVLVGTGLRRLKYGLEQAGFKAIEQAANMYEAVKAAFKAASPGDVVLLSPGSSSFDLFKNYEERGEAFKDAVGRLKKT